MNSSGQKRKIKRFLRGILKKDIDVFCIYQWVERCHYEGWWHLATDLGSRIPPNSLMNDYQKRFEFLLRESAEHYETQKASFIEEKKKLEKKIAAFRKKYKEIKIDGLDEPALAKERHRINTRSRTSEKVRTFVLEGKEYTSSSYIDAYIKLIATVVQKYPERIERLFSFQSRQRKLFSLDKTELSSATKPVPGTSIWAAIHGNPNVLHERGIKVLQLFEMDANSFRILTTENP